MKIDCNEIFFVLPKDKEHVQDPMQVRLDDVIDFNTWQVLSYFAYEQDSKTNTIRHVYMQEYGHQIDFDLVLKVPYKWLNEKEYAYASYYPNSIEQARFLCTLGVDTEFLNKLYHFQKDDICHLQS
jgi:hypothetical protein